MQMWQLLGESVCIKLKYFCFWISTTRDVASFVPNKNFQILFEICYFGVMGANVAGLESKSLLFF